MFSDTDNSYYIRCRFQRTKEWHENVDLCRSSTTRNKSQISRPPSIDVLLNLHSRLCLSTFSNCLMCSSWESSASLCSVSCFIRFIKVSTSALAPSNSWQEKGRERKKDETLTAEKSTCFPKSALLHFFITSIFLFCYFSSASSMEKRRTEEEENGKGKKNKEMNKNTWNAQIKFISISAS